MCHLYPGLISALGSGEGPFSCPPCQERREERKIPLTSSRLQVTGIVRNKGDHRPVALLLTLPLAPTAMVLCLAARGRRSDDHQVQTCARCSSPFGTFPSRLGYKSHVI